MLQRLRRQYAGALPLAQQEKHAELVSSLQEQRRDAERLREEARRGREEAQVGLLYHSC